MILLKELRKEKGLTQLQVANSLKISRQVYANYENEVNQPDCKMLVILANFFEVSIDFLLGRSDDFGNVNIQRSTYTFSSEERELLAIFDKMTAAQKARFIGIGEGMIESSADKTQIQKLF